MINRKNILGLIPARGGSKGVPKKNIKDLPENLSMDKGDIEKLAQYFPFEAKESFTNKVFLTRCMLQRL